jgi:glutamate--cysteine ligase
MLTDLMSQVFDQSDADQLLGFGRGIEREALRTTKAGQLSLTAHPSALGEKLTHPLVTTDFSEAQLELITPVHNSNEAVLHHLKQIHQWTAQRLDGEQLWPGSMPCALPSDDQIPLAYYGDSNAGRLKTTYRHGLGLRYHRTMQTICAVHYNFSFNQPFFRTPGTAVRAL